MQADFAREFFRLCRAEGLHTALDTAGSIVTDKALAVLDYTDLVLLDIKALRPELCRRVCGADSAHALQMLDELQRRRIPVWIRHVVVPGLTDDDTELDALVDYLRAYDVIEKIEWLPYHTMGVYKYEALGLDYPLDGVEPLSKARIDTIRERYKDVFPVKI